MENKVIFSNISVYSISHGLVDATCAALMFAIFFLNFLEFQTFVYLVILYNVLAFALQAPFGLLIDKIRMPVHSAIIGVLFVAIATLFIKTPFIAGSIAGIGNALFHVGGGIISLNLIPKKATMPGIYVAPGALGLMIGALVGKSGSFVAWPFIILLVLASLLIWKIKRPKINYDTTLKGNFKWFEIAILLLLVSIGIRGLIGLSLVLPWKSNISLLALLTIAVVLGKAFGGILGDKYGWMKVALTGLIVAAPLLSFFTSVPYLAIIGAFFFNLTMPITLTAIANMLPGRVGFAFGLTTLALIIGAFPTFSPLKPLLNNQIFILSIIITSIIALYIGLKLYFDHFHKKARFLKNKV
jgi:FSR family fosmidomycin resistance protein-like MFS transporter